MHSTDVKKLLSGLIAEQVYTIKCKITNIQENRASQLIVSFKKIRMHKTQLLTTVTEIILSMF